MQRRDFLKKFVKWIFSLFSLGSISSLIFFYPPELRERPIQFLPVIEENKKPKRGVKVVTFSYKHNGKEAETSVFLVAIPGSEELLALSPTCTHLGCKVYWDRLKNEFSCPCHGGKYDMYGRVIDGPPPASLVRLPVKITDHMVNIGLKV